MRCIVLCAGVGERLRPDTYKTNKSLLKIGGKTLIEHWLDALISSGAEVDTAHIIIGHYGYKFRHLLGSTYRGRWPRPLKIRFHVNPLYKITGAAHSLYLASNIMKNNPCIILEGDHYLDPELMKRLVESEYENCLLVDEDQSKLKFDEEVIAYGHMGTVDYLMWPPPKHFTSKDLLGEALTIFKLSKEASNALATILEDYLLEEGPAIKEIIEPFNRLMPLHDLHYVGFKGKEWIEVDFPLDLEKARGMKFE